MREQTFLGLPLQAIEGKRMDSLTQQFNRLMVGLFVLLYLL